MFDFSHLGGMGGIMSMLPQMQTPSNFLGNMINGQPLNLPPQLGQMAEQLNGQGGGGFLNMLGHSQLGPALAQAFPGLAQGWNNTSGDPTGVGASGAMGGDMGGGPTGAATLAPWGQGGDIHSMMNHPMMLSMLSRFGLGNNFNPAGGGQFGFQNGFQNAFSQHGFAPGGSSYQT